MSSITFHPVIASNTRRRDGTYPVRIRITYKGVSRRLPTNLVAYPQDVTRSCHIKSANLLNKAQVLIRQMQETIEDLSPFAVADWDVDRVVRFIRGKLEEKTFRLDFFKYADKFVAKKNESTRLCYVAAVNSLERYIGQRELDINDITKRLLMGWMEEVDNGGRMSFSKGKIRKTKRPQGPGHSTRMLAKIAAIFNAAKREYNDDDLVLIPRNPFDGIPKVTPPPQGQHNLGPELMQKIIDAASTPGKYSLALSVFVLSFCTMGANMADLWAARDVGPVWVYNRQKTKSRRQDRAEMRVTILPEMRFFLSRLGARSRGAWLTALHTYSGTCNGCTHKVNRALKSWAEHNGVEPFTFYAARKTWASLARRAGVEKATIDECLTHIGDFRTADIYIERDYDLMNEANARVLASLRFPPLRYL